MRRIRDHWGVTIDVTSRCNRRCAHCSRGLRHLPRLDYSLEAIEQALDSLQGWPGGVECLGGEPTYHYDFPAVCALWRRYVPKWRAVLAYGNPGPTPEQRADIDRTFGLVTYNDHHNGSLHEPLLVTMFDLGLSLEEMERRAQRCWLHWKWCSRIVPGVGAYFCEPAATLDMLFNGGRGMPIERGWWKRPIPAEQLMLCYYCGICHGLPPSKDTARDEVVSPFWAERLGLPVNMPAATGTEHVHYAVPDGVHHKITRGPRIWLRQKRFGWAYYWRKRWLWPAQDALRKVFA